jgi:hypothetical protein
MAKKKPATSASCSRECCNIKPFNDHGGYIPRNVSMQLTGLAAIAAQRLLDTYVGEELSNGRKVSNRADAIIYYMEQIK